MDLSWDGWGVQKLTTASTIAPLYLTRHRLYSATLCRFVSADPLGLAGGLNLYGYGNGDPLTYIDPFGLCSETSIWISIVDWTQVALDVVGTFDPTFISDGINSSIYLIRGNYEDAAFSAVAMIPYVGDLSKVGKYGRKTVKYAQRIEKTGRKAGKKYATSTEARKAAEAMGWKYVKGLKSKDGEAVYKNGRRYFSRDNSVHKGGVWKEVDRTGERQWTVDDDLKRIGK